MTLTINKKLTGGQIGITCETRNDFREEWNALEWIRIIYEQNHFKAGTI